MNNTIRSLHLVPLVSFAFLLGIVALASAAEFPTTTVFEARDGYPVYRIPAVIRAANGDLLAFCEARRVGTPVKSTWC